MTALRLGTRRSPLALAQKHLRGGRAHRRDRVERSKLVEIVIEGDRNPGPLASLVGGGAFTSALREPLWPRRHRLRGALPQGPANNPEPGLLIAAVPPREDPRDVLVSRGDLGLGGLPAGSRVAELALPGPPRLRALGYGLDVVDIRGQRRHPAAQGCGCRGRRPSSLPRAGLARLGRLDAVTEVLDPTQMLPAPARVRSR